MEKPDYMPEDDEVIDYDGEVANDGDAFTTLPEGDEVTFTITEIEKARNKDGTKPQVTVKLSCVSVNGHGRTGVKDYITMTRKSEWKLCEFFTALGLRKHGEKLALRWDIIGLTGRATVTVDSFTGKQGDVMKSNKIKHYLEPVAGSEPITVDGEPSFG